MFKLFHPKKNQPKTIDSKEKESHMQEKSKSETKLKRQKKIYPGKEDGGPLTRSKTGQEDLEIKKSYADILKKPTNNHKRASAIN